MPLLACLNDEQDIVQLLLEAGSNIYAKNLHNCMPAHLAVKVCESSCIPHFLLLVERHIMYTLFSGWFSVLLKTHNGSR